MTVCLVQTLFIRVASYVIGLVWVLFYVLSGNGAYSGGNWVSLSDGTFGQVCCISMLTRLLEMNEMGRPILTFWVGMTDLAQTLDQTM